MAIILRDIALERGLDEEDIVEFLQDFVEYTESEDMPGLKAAVDARDHVTAKQKAHSIKGAALNLKLADIAADAEKIEKKAAQGDLDGVPEILGRLAREFDEVKVFLSGLA